MTDPLDDTQPQPVAPPAPPQPNVLGSQAASGPAGSEAAGPGTGDTPGSGTADPGPATPPPTPDNPPLQASPQTTPSDWREPPWYPPRERGRNRGPSVIAIVVGLVVLAIGLYYFLDTTLGLDLPAFSWGSLWPVILIVIGGVIVLRAMSRRS